MNPVKSWTPKDQEIIKGILNIVREDEKHGTSVKISPYQIEDELFFEGYANVKRRDKYMCDVQFTQKGIDLVAELKAMNIKGDDIKNFYWYMDATLLKRFKAFDPINTKFVMETRGAKDQSMIDIIKDVKKKKKVTWGFTQVLGATNMVDSIIDGKVTFNQKEIDKYIKSSTSRQKSIAKKVVGYRWNLDQVNWDRQTTKICSISYYCNEINAQISIHGDSLSSYKASIQHALKHNKQEVLEHLRNSTPPEMMILFTEAILGGMTAVRDIVNDAPSIEAKELDSIKTKEE